MLSQLFLLPCGTMKSERWENVPWTAFFLFSLAVLFIFKHLTRKIGEKNFFICGKKKKQIHLGRQAVCAFFTMIHWCCPRVYNASASSTAIEIVSHTKRDTNTIHLDELRMIVNDGHDETVILFLYSNDNLLAYLHTRCSSPSSSFATFLFLYHRRSI